MCGGGVDHPHLAGRIDQRDGLARRIVGQAQEREVGFVERLAARRGILAPRVVEREQRELAAAGEPVGYVRVDRLEAFL